MKIKTSELIGPPLDWAVAVANGMDPETARLFHDAEELQVSTSGDTVIEIMERERIVVDTEHGDPWRARFGRAHLTFDGRAYHYHHQEGPTLRIAVCRCFVASKLGDEIDVPEELMK